MSTISRQLAVDWIATGQVGTLAYRVLAPDNTVLIARTTTGVVESPAGSGSYYVIVNWNTAWGAKIQWDDGAVFYTEWVPVIQPVDTDGLSYATYTQTLLAFAAGLTGFVDNMDETYTLTFKRHDGTTTALTVTAAKADGHRTVATITP